MSDQTGTPDGAPSAPTDNATPPVGSPPAPATPPPPEPVRNVDDLKNVIKQRERLKSENETLRAQFAKLEKGELLAEHEALRLQLQQQTSELEAIKAADAAKAGQLAEQSRAGRRTAITDVILARAHEGHRDELKMLLPGLHEAGDIDLYSESPTDEAAKGLETLAKRFPKYFRAADGAPQGGTPGAPSPSYGNPSSWNDLTPEQKAKMSPEDFKKLFGSGGGQFGGAGPIVTRPR